MQLQDSLDKRLGSQHLLRFNQSLSTVVVQPEAGGDENQQREPEKKAALSFKAGLANDLLEGSIRNHAAIPEPFQAAELV